MLETTAKIENTRQLKTNTRDVFQTQLNSKGDTVYDSKPPLDAKNAHSKNNTLVEYGFTQLPLTHKTAIA